LKKLKKVEKIKKNAKKYEKILKKCKKTMKECKKARKSWVENSNFQLFRAFPLFFIIPVYKISILK